MTRKVSIALMALALAACDGPSVGTLVFDLTTPRSDDGAIQFAITARPGYEVLSLEAACAGCRLFTRTVDEQHTLGIVTGPVGAGALLRATVSQADKPASYEITVLEVASRSYQLQPLDGYAISITR
jgi:hypothetical protein